MSEILSGIMSLFCLFSYTSQLRSYQLTSSFGEPSPFVTFCWFKPWRNRQDDRRPEASRGMTAVFPRRARTCLSIIITYLAFVKEKVSLHHVAPRRVAARGRRGRSRACPSPVGTADRRAPTRVAPISAVHKIAGWRRHLTFGVGDPPVAMGVLGMIQPMRGYSRIVVTPEI